VFAVVIGVMYLAVASLGNWKPKLGLDLQGGTRITLQAQAIGGSVTSDKLSQAVDIISSRVNGAGEVSLNFCALTEFISPERAVTVPRRFLRRVLLAGDRVFQLERLHSFNRKFFPEWRPRYLCVEKISDLPVVGVPLPLVSYGGTSMLTMMVGLGFVLNAHVNRQVHIRREEFGLLW
jgi:hypothetical protein